MPPVGLLGTTMMMVGAAALLVVLLLVISARRRPQPSTPTNSAAPIDARHPMGEIPASPDAPKVARLPAVVLASHAGLVKELREVQAELASLRMAHVSQRARVGRARDFLGRAGAPGLRLVSGGKPGDAVAARDREIERLRTALSAAESHLLAASSAGAIRDAGPSQESLVPSAASDVPGGPTTLPPVRKHTMSVTRATHQPSAPQRTRRVRPS